MKIILTFISVLSVFAHFGQNITPIDEVSIGVNYSLPTGEFIDGYISPVVSEQFVSKPGFSVGVLNRARKNNIFQFAYGVEFNYLSNGYVIDYNTINLDTTTWQGASSIQDDLRGNLNSMIISIPLILRWDFAKTNKNIPFFIDTGIKYDFITVSRSKYEMDYYKIYYDYTSEYYVKEKLEGKTRFYNKRSNLALNFGVGTTIKRYSVRLSYNYYVSTLKNIVLDYYGKGDIKNDYLNFSINYKLKK